jgi:hypothetical protein
MRTLEEASVWPDCVRGLRPRFAFADAWHYQNISICRAFDIGSKCADGNCVTAQIPVQLDVLADRRRGPAARAQALAFFVHFIGDMHQPLHVGEKDDLGGNRVRVRYGALTDPRMNLHRIWDGELAERALTAPPAIAPEPGPPAPANRAALAGQVAQWAEESWRISRDLAYPGLGPVAAACPLGDGPAEVPAGRFGVDEAYVEAARDPIRERVTLAGARIAALLNAALDPRAR